MTDLHRSYCKSCEKKNGDGDVVAVKYGVCKDWGALNYLFHIIMLLATGFFWVGFLLVWLIVSYPRYRCQNCNSILDEKDLRL